MSILETDVKAIAHAAYEIAWKTFITFTRLTPDEKETAPRKLREYIDVLISSGESDPEKIAQSSLGLLREYEQIARSTARVTSSPSITP